MPDPAIFNDGDRKGDNYIFDGAKRAEVERLERQSQCLNTMMHNKPFHAPVTNPTKILEIGCGTGLNSCQLGRLYPNARVIGVDLVAVPPIPDQPLNVQFVQGRFEDLLESLGQGSFDYVFSRMLLIAIDDWPLFTSRIMTLLKPGGWVEMQELNSLAFYTTASPDEVISNDWRFVQVMRKESLARGMNVTAGSELVFTMRSAGLESVMATRYKMPCVPFPEEPQLQDIYEYLQEFSAPVELMLLERYCEGRYSEEEIEELKEEAREKRYRGKIEGLYRSLYAVVGRKK